MGKLDVLLAKYPDIKVLQNRQPWLWINSRRALVKNCLHSLSLKREDILDAESRLQRFAPLLAELFPELRPQAGMIESELLAASSLAEIFRNQYRIAPCRNLFIKADHALPVAGSIKARGGIYAVLHFAEQMALETGLLNGPNDDYLRLNTPQAREIFHTRELSVASTGNLGLSIGIMGRALGFPVTVHMSMEAKSWKKERLRKCGANVVEHESDYTAACDVARAIAQKNHRIHFIDDENSIELFLGYSVAALRLQRQLENAGIMVDEEHPLFVYLPCGVGGAPGGITFGARHVFGDYVHCFFGEPVEAPCMLLGMLTGRHADISIYEIGLELRTDADGLAVSTPSRFVGQLMEPLLSGCYTVDDGQLYRFIAELYETERIEVEPSSAAGCAGLGMVLGTRQGRAYLEDCGLVAHLDRATHIIWTTGGKL